MQFDLFNKPGWRDYPHLRGKVTVGYLIRKNLWTYEEADAYISDMKHLGIETEINEGEDLLDR